MRIILLLLLTHFFFTPLAYGTDFSTNVRSGSNSLDFETGGYLELAGLVGYENTAFDVCASCDGSGAISGLVFSGEYRYKRAFVEASLMTLDGLNLGITLLARQHWSLDFLAASAFGELVDDDFESDFANLSEEEKNKRINERETFFNGTGMRLTTYYYDVIMQFMLLKDTHGGNGVLADVKIGQSWQYRNWNYHGIFNVKWGTDEVGDYWLGVDDAHATERFPAHKAGSGFFYLAELGVTYPISQNWVFRSVYRYGMLDSESRKSPRVDGRYNAVLALSISYVW